MISIIIPYFNEAESMPLLIKKIHEIGSKMAEPYEVVAVDDGSTDRSSTDIKNIKVIHHRIRLGKGKALQTGIDNSTGEIIAFMDGDLQDDPSDLPRFYKKIQSGYDFVNGARVKRQDSIIIKIYSSFLNKFLQLFLHVPLSDVNCGYKMFRREILTTITLYGNNFRFFPLAAYLQGFKVTDIAVTNHPRLFGQSKFGPWKIFGGIFDTLTAYFIYKFAEKPLHFFGPIGLLLFIPGLIITCFLVYERIFFGILLYRRPALLLAILLVIVGLQIIMTGVIGELIVFFNKKKK